MRCLSLVSGIALAACSQSPAKDSPLPLRFTLKCGAPTLTGPQSPSGAEKGFNVIIDRTANTFSMPWWNKRPLPIKKIEPNEITLMNAHVDRGIDNNPEDRRISFDLRTHTLHFYEAYSAFVPMLTSFSSHCEIADA